MNERLGRYELLAELGSGGMASVWLARMRGPGDFEKRVAVKRIHPHLADDPDLVAMFLDEARIAACVDHPNVCSTIDFGEANGTHFLAMDVVRGRNVAELADALGQGEHGMTTRERCALVARIVIDAAEGLHAVHEARSPEGTPLGAVHRDVAPANLLVRWDGVTQVTDFGCASVRDMACAYRSAPGESRGHPSYTAPESLRRAEPDRRVDVWALGVVLWELLVGEPLFRRNAVHDTLFAIADEEPPAPSSKDEAIPAELDRIVARALAKDPEGRYPTARHLAEELRAWLRGAGLAMDPPQVVSWLERLFPEGDALAEGSIPAPATDRRPTRPTAVPAEVVDSRMRSLLASLQQPVVLAAMVIGLGVGLGATAALTELEDAARPAETVRAATLPSHSPQAPLMVRVPGELPEEAAGAEPASTELGSGVHVVNVRDVDVGADAEHDDAGTDSQ